LALLSLVLPPDLPLADFTALIDGFLALAAAQGVTLAGGNITRSPGPLIVDVTAVGTIRRRRVLTRGGARPGDDVWVSGELGRAAAGLGSLAGGLPRDPAMADCEAAFLTPEPRVRLGMLLGRNRAASACVDLSDGLADGLHQLALASGLGLEIDGEVIPIAPPARAWFEARGQDALLSAVSSGDDYELLFTVRPRHRSRFATVRRQIGAVTLTRIGVVSSTPGVTMKRNGATGPVPSGYAHFR